MKNSEFLNTLLVSGKIESVDLDYVYSNIEDVDTSIFNIQRYYNRFKDKLKWSERFGNGISNLILTLGYLMGKEIDKETEEKIFGLLEFLFDLFVGDGEYSELLNAIEMAEIEGNGYNNIRGSYLESSNIQIGSHKLHIVRGKTVDIVDVNYNKVYENVICIEKDLNTNNVKVVCGSGYKAIDDRAYKKEFNKFKLVF